MNRKAIINHETSVSIRKKLHSLDYETIEIPPLEKLAKPLVGHPDLQIFIHDNRLFYHPEIPVKFLRQIEKYIDVIKCSEKLTDSYPGDISYNIACSGNVAFHKIDRTAEKIKIYFKDKDINLVEVSQGYSRCSTVIVDSNHIITADKGIHNAALLNNVESLLVSPGHVELPGYKYGFLGGASGMTGNTVFFTGSIDHHPDKEIIINFIESAGKSICFLSENKIVDLGSILFF